MKRISELIRGRLLSGVIDIQDPLTSLRHSEWSPEFERLMRNRLIMGVFRYGKLHGDGKAEYNRPADIIRRIKNYVETGNLEDLVDAANICMLEFEESILRAAVSKWGKKQLHKVREECAELVVAIDRLENNRPGAIKDVYQETADVLIMINYVILLLGEKEFKRWVEKKMERLKRIVYADDFEQETAE